MVISDYFSEVNMRFSHKDKKDARVFRQSTYAFDFPEKVEQAPIAPGVFVLLNEHSDVLYVGSARGDDLQLVLAEHVGNITAENVVSYRWFITENQKVAAALAKDWIEKYQPQHQLL